jgi:hypothetical protein
VFNRLVDIYTDKVLLPAYESVAKKDDPTLTTALLHSGRAYKRFASLFAGNKHFDSERRLQLTSEWLASYQDSNQSTDPDADDYYATREQAVTRLTERIQEHDMPTVSMVRERLGSTVAEAYRASLEQLQNHPNPEFQVEPQFSASANMNTSTMMKAVEAVDRLSCGDVDELADIYQQERDEKKRKRRANRQSGCQSTPGLRVIADETDVPQEVRDTIHDTHVITGAPLEGPEELRVCQVCLVPGLNQAQVPVKQTEVDLEQNNTLTRTQLTQH